MKHTHKLSLLCFLIAGFVLGFGVYVHANGSTAAALSSSQQNFTLFDDTETTLQSEPINDGKSSGSVLTSGEFNRVLELLGTGSTDDGSLAFSAPDCSNYAANTWHEASNNGFVTITSGFNSAVTGYSGVSTTINEQVLFAHQRDKYGQGQTSTMMPIKSGHFWKVDGAASLCVTDVTGGGSAESSNTIPGESGSTTLGSGMSMKWGVLKNVSLNQTFHTITFPTAFANNTYNVQATVSYPTVISGAAPVVIKNLSKNGFEVAGDHVTATTTGNIYWTAIGN